MNKHYASTKWSVSTINQFFSCQLYEWKLFVLLPLSLHYQWKQSGGYKSSPHFYNY